MNPTEFLEVVDMHIKAEAGEKFKRYETISRDPSTCIDPLVGDHFIIENNILYGAMGGFHESMILVDNGHIEGIELPYGGSLDTTRLYTSENGRKNLLVGVDLPVIEGEVMVRGVISYTDRYRSEELFLGFRLATERFTQRMVRAPDEFALDSAMIPLVAEYHTPNVHQDLSHVIKRVARD